MGEPAQPEGIDPTPPALSDQSNLTAASAIQPGPSDAVIAVKELDTATSEGNAPLDAPNPPKADAQPSSTPTPIPPPTPASPAPRRPRPPTKGILKPPPPPARPTLSNRLRDFAGAAKSLFDPLEDDMTNTFQINGQGSSSLAGSSSASTSAISDSPVSSAFTAFSGRLGAGFNRLVVAASQASAVSPSASPQGSPMGIKSISLPDGVAPLLNHNQSDKARQKQPLKRATFVLPSLSITYPISSQGEPWSQKVIEDRDKVSIDHLALEDSGH